MTINPTAALRTLVLAAIVLTPFAASAQDARPAPAEPATRTGVQASAPTATASLGTRPWTEEEYRLGPGDKLRVEVYREAQLSQSLQVRPDGKITLPLVGDILAAGRTALELRDEVTDSLTEYITNPVVTVIVQEALANQVTVMGEVSSPGPQILLGPTTVLQALAQAGGLKEFAKQRDIRILRISSNGLETIPFNYRDALNGRTDPMFLRPGDMVVVP